MSEIYEKQYQTLMADWSYTKTSIRGLDEIIFKIRGWAITLTSGALGYAYINKDSNLCLYIGLPILLIWVMDGLYKSFQRRFIERDNNIRDYFNSGQFVEDLEAKKISSIQLSQVWNTNKADWFNEAMRNHVKAMLLRNVALTYIPLIIFQAITFIIIKYPTIQTP